MNSDLRTLNVFKRLKEAGSKNVTGFDETLKTDSFIIDPVQIFPGKLYPLPISSPEQGLEDRELGDLHEGRHHGIPQERQQERDNDEILQKNTLRGSVKELFYVGRGGIKETLFMSLWPITAL